MTMQGIIDRLGAYAEISSEAKSTLAGMLVPTAPKKGTVLLREGTVCQHMHFMTQGFARAFFYKNGRDITSWFAQDNDILTPLDSFVGQRPSYENVELLEDSMLYSLSYRNLQFLYRHYPETNAIGRMLTEQYYVELMERTMAFQFQTATERYRDLQLRQPNLLQRASLGHIASFLGISQETLSRIRTKT